MNRLLDIPTLVQHQVYLRYADVAALSVLVFDYSLTLDLEVAYVWGSKWSFVKVEYMIIRYMPFISLSSVFMLDVPGPTAQVCSSITKAYAIMLVFDTGLGELILTIRTWAICGRRFRMGIAFVIFFSIKTTIVYVIIAFWMIGLRYTLIPAGFGHNSGTCALVSSTKILWSAWILVVVFEFVVCTVLAFEAISSFHAGGMSQLARVVYRDGLMYYIYLMAVFVGVATSIIILPAYYRKFDMIRFLSGPAHALHVLLTARVVLHAREQANKSATHDVSSSFFTQSY
ncbi:hypothetical protein APHAL10511_006694 [Amanita phalloides]|nr:hypothetical protein APHAL10511_006694 [Amanita phalloides]